MALRTLVGRLILRTDADGKLAKVEKALEKVEKAHEDLTKKTTKLREAFGRLGRVARVYQDIRQRVSRLRGVQWTVERFRKAHERLSRTWKRMKRTLRKYTYGVRGLIAAYLGFETVRRVLFETSRNLVVLATEARSLKVPIKFLDALRRHFEGMGYQADKANDVIKDFQKISSQISAGQGTKQMLSALEEMGLTVQQWQSMSVTDQLGYVLSWLRQLPEAQRRAKAQWFFGEENSKYASRLAETMIDFVRKYTRWNEAGALATQKQVQAAKAWQEAMTNLKTIVAGALRVAFVQIREDLKTIGEWLSWIGIDGVSNVQELGKWFARLLELVVALYLFSKLWQALQLGVSFLQFLMANPLLALMLVLIGAIVGAGYMLYKLFTEDSRALEDFWEGVKKAVTDALGWIWKKVKELPKLLWKLVKWLSEGVVKLGKMAWDAISSAIDKLWEGIKGAASSVWDWLKQKGIELVNWLLKPIRMFLRGAGKLLAKAGEKLHIDKLKTWGKKLQEMAEGVKIGVETPRAGTGNRVQVSNHVRVGEVVVNVQGTNATPKQIGKAVQGSMRDLLGPRPVGAYGD